MIETVNEENATAEQARRFVTDLYRVMLRREPDSEGLDFYSRKLLAGAGHRELIDSFLDSDEYWKLADAAFPIDYAPPGEAGRSYARRVRNGFYDRYCHGPLILDVGFSGFDNPEGKTAVPGAIGIDLDYPGYDGVRLPYADNSVDTVISSHCLEHILFEHAAIQDWYRVLRIGGHIICMVPHQMLYEKKRFVPSNWNHDHKRMYTVSRLAASFEAALPINGFRIRHLVENDAGFDYSLGPDQHSQGAYEIELVLEKISTPTWTLA
jgi:predicted SAM-dependent methyltransferase